MSELYLRFFQEITEGRTWNAYIVLIEHSSSINQEEAMFRAQKQLVESDFVITKVEFPYIWCYKFEKSTEEE